MKFLLDEYRHDHRSFGGVINPSDFNTDCRGNDNKRSSIADRIFTDWKFDNECRKNIEFRKKKLINND